MSLTSWTTYPQSSPLVYYDKSNSYIRLISVIIQKNLEIGNIYPYT